MAEKITETTLSDCTVCVNFNLRKAMRAVSQHYDKILAPAKLRCTQFTILTILSRMGTMTVTDLAENLVMDRTTLTRNLKPLEKEGYLTILPNVSDRRTRNIAITRVGKKAQETAMPYWRQAQNEMIAFMGEEDARRLISSSQKISTLHQPS